MLTHTSSPKPTHKPLALYAAMLVMSLFILTFSAGCRSHNSASEETRFVAASDADDFHADNDIAMTIRSLADAIKVGEPLDSTLYDFEGVLTDGQGTPLYTDIQGSPGLWEIDVLDNRNVLIRNVYLGDLLPGDLETYLLQSLSLSDSAPFATIESDSLDNEDSGKTIYDFGGGFLSFEIKPGMAPNGLEGPMLSIIMSADYPDLISDGIQTNGSVQNVAKP